MAEGKDLAALRKQLAPKAREVVAEATDDVERTGLLTWTPGTLARVVAAAAGRPRRHGRTRRWSTRPTASG